MPDDLYWSNVKAIDAFDSTRARWEKSTSD